MKRLKRFMFKTYYIHDKDDPVRYMAAPSNIINQAGQLITGREVNSPIYVPNPIDPLIGLMNMGNMSQHSVTNPLYMQHIDPELKESLK